ncbi:YdeI/OmpD-associated family protein [Ketogulonicigenium vulgare]|uniref:YdhG-like domain-containing protein n=1 Tax=Ketogulonicigenium vulgare (strain WSH-001) TaxID=759362 RepID=F9Y9S4_KETVW|nr:YdeI/OmpD-associated family protein [Ketogulonicigenium vulgare]ADO41953.1 conserved hypothetical protein [Ketogulonicigenium vulgare Y25]AEM40176.1 hypothetical protein KVU_0337 [Ketogulonicigenium vulgare WSH-001]ALJ82250.1 hypothetical protein KVH_03815 [Ketogulonicigenium vulgare]ANW34915.1 hypothetical protein KvSKV_03785 [Ketogulonicigenium vulgare]AOZ53878.1 hypothetical protein KVC_0861 [Ketogulonicigenium vulgare]
MAEMITDPDVFFADGCGRCARYASDDCAARRWGQGLAALRQICRDAGLSEVAKWGHPCYMHAGRNIAIIGAFRDDFRLSFFDAALLKDPAGVLQRQGANTPHPDMLRFTDSAQVGAMGNVISAYLAEAMANAAAGLRPPKIETHVDMPVELQEALDEDPSFAAAFDALTPGRRKSYLIALSGAKAAQTRRDRIEKLRPKIFEGKGALER